MTNRSRPSPAPMVVHGISVPLGFSDLMSAPVRNDRNLLSRITRLRGGDEPDSVSRVTLSGERPLGTP